MNWFSMHDLLMKLKHDDYSLPKKGSVNVQKYINTRNVPTLDIVLNIISAALHDVRVSYDY